MHGSFQMVLILAGNQMSICNELMLMIETSIVILTSLSNYQVAEAGSLNK